MLAGHAQASLPEHSKMRQVTGSGVMQSDVQIHHLDCHVLTEISVVESGSDLRRRSIMNIHWQQQGSYAGRTRTCTMSHHGCFLVYCLIDTQNMFPEGM